MKYEQWKAVPGYEGLYEVSDLGRVRSSAHGKVLKQRASTRGYLRVGLTKDGRQTMKSVHRLVLLAFVGGSDMQVNHLNEQKMDNRLTNICYCTAAENNNYGSRTARAARTLGKRIRQVDRTGRTVAEYISAADAARKTGLSRGSISSCASHQKGFKTCGGYSWEYV